MPPRSSPSSGCRAPDGSASVAGCRPGARTGDARGCGAGAFRSVPVSCNQVASFPPRVSSAGEEPVELALLGTVKERVPLLHGEPHGARLGSLAVADLDPSGMAPCLYATTPVAGRPARHDPSDLGVHHHSSVFWYPRVPHGWLAACLPMTSLGDHAGRQNRTDSWLCAS